MTYEEWVKSIRMALDVDVPTTPEITAWLHATERVLQEHMLDPKVREGLEKELAEQMAIEMDRIIFGTGSFKTREDGSVGYIPYGIAPSMWKPDEPRS